MLKRNAVITIVSACLISITVVFIFEIPSRPFTAGEIIILYVLALSISLGIALFFDPKAKEKTKNLSKINFYEEV